MPSLHLQRPGIACCGACARPVAAFPVKRVNAVIELMGTAGTGFDAGSAGDAARGEEPDLGIRVLPFGVMAPETVQCTALEEYGRSYAGPVVEGKPLYVKNHASSGHENRASHAGSKKGVRDPAYGKVGRLVKELVGAR